MHQVSKSEFRSMAGQIKPRHGAIAIALLAGMTFGATSASADGLTVGLGGLGAVTVGGSSVANVDTNVAGVGVKADVLGNNHVATACVGSCASGTSGNVGTGDGIGVTVGGVGNGTDGGIGVTVGGGSTGGGIGVTIGGGGTTVAGGGTGGNGGGTGGGTGNGTGGGTPLPLQVGSNNNVAVAGNMMRCKSGGNTAVYDGFTVIDRHGVFVGWVNDAKIDPSLKITEVRMLTADHHCVAMVGGNFKINGSQMTVTNIEASQMP